MSLLLKNPEYKDFKELSQKRIDEAKILLDSGQYSGAYYLAGYSIELAFKACYCKTVKEKSFPPKRDIYNKLYNHNLSGLLDVSGIKLLFNEELSKNINLNTNWETVKDWNEESRYAVMLKKDAKLIVEAILDDDGVLGLIKKLW